MGVDADVCARASVAAWVRLVESIPGAWARRDGGAVGIMSGVELPGFNGVWGEARDVSPDAVASLLDAVADAGVPHCMELRPGWPAEVDEIAGARGLVRVAGEPLMVLEDDRRIRSSEEVEGLSIRQLRPEEGALHASIAAGGGVVGRDEPYRRAASPEVLRMEGLRCYVGEVGGAGVTTALSVTTTDCVGIFSVATLPEHRRHGYGAAVTARAVRDGLASGARWAWLCASPSGYPVYRALGFATVEHLDFWQRRSS